MINRLTAQKIPVPELYSPTPDFSMKSRVAEHRPKNDRTGRRVGVSQANRIMTPEIMAMEPNPANISALVSLIKALAGHRLTNPRDPSKPTAVEHYSGFQFMGLAGTLVRVGHVNLPDGILITDGPQPDIYLLSNGNAQERAQMTDQELNFAMGMLKFAATAAYDPIEDNWRRTG
jgi:hypothetical protein